MFPMFQSCGNDVATEYLYILFNLFKKDIKDFLNIPKITFS